MIFDDVIRTRRSIRAFTPTPIEARAVTEIVDAARISPSAKNRQPWYFSVLDGEEKNRFADKMTAAAQAADNFGALATAKIIREAPVLIAVCKRIGCGESDILSIGGAMYAMCLKATDLGLGSLWIADTDVLSVYEEYRDLIGAVAVGYAAEYPSARPRLALDEVSNLRQSTESGIVQYADDPFVLGVPDRNFVFVSYSHKDGAAVTADAIELKKHGIPLWYDFEMEKGREWDSQATDILENGLCRVFLFYVSYYALRSPAVLAEFRAARELLKTGKEFCILPVVVGEENVATLLGGLEREGMGQYAEEYAAYFSKENKLLYITRSKNPADGTHIEEIIRFLKSKDIIDDPSVYESFSYEVRGDHCVITAYKGTGTDITVPDKISGLPVEEIGAAAFADKPFIQSVKIPTTVKCLDVGAFRATGIREISIPPSVTEIRTACFRDCVSLKRITLPPHITYIAEATFRGCTALAEITVPEGVAELEEAVFRSCTSLRIAKMPTSLRKMTEGGFWGCSSLEELIIPTDIEGLEIGSFDTAPRLNRVTAGGFVFEKGKGRLL